MDKNLISKYEKMSVQAKAAIWFVFCSLLQKGISFITVPIFTRILTTGEYGTYSLFLSWLEMLTIFTSLNLYYGVFNNGMSKYEKNRDQYISAMQGLIITLCALSYCVYVAFSGFWNSFLQLSPYIIFLMFLEMLFAPALQFWAGRQRFEYRYRSLVGITLTKSLANPILGIIMVTISSNDKASARIISVVITEVIISGIIMVKQFVKGKCFFIKEYWKYALTLAIPVLPHYLAGTLLSQGDRIMIGKMVSNDSVAVYSVAYSIGMLVQIFTNAISNSLTPWMYEKVKKREFSSIQNIIHVLIILVSGIVLCLMMLTPEATMIFGSEEYIEAIYVIPPVAASTFFIFLYNIFAIPEFYYEKTKFLMISSIGAAALNIVLNYFFISVFGYIAAGYTTLICYVLYSVGHYITSLKITRDNAGKNVQLYNSKFILMISVVVITLSVLVQFIYPYWFVRYAVIIAVMVLIVKKKQSILQYVRILKEK